MYKITEDSHARTREKFIRFKLPEPEKKGVMCTVCRKVHDARKF